MNHPIDQIVLFTALEPVPPSLHDEIFPGDNQLFVAGQTLDDLHPILDPAAEFHRDLMRLSILHHIDILEFFQPADGIEGNLDRVEMCSTSTSTRANMPPLRR